MPYIAIKAYKKDEKTKRQIVDKINDLFVELWGCGKEAITISIEEYTPTDWEEKVYKGEVLKNTDKMMILSGEKKY